MSFSSEVKKELARNMSPARHCQIAELAAIMSFCGQYGRDEAGHYIIGFQTENEALVRKGFTLLRKTYNIDNGIILDEDTLQGILQKIGTLEEPVSSLVVKNTCCQRAFLRGAFLSVGSISDPAKGYHLEFACADQAKAEQIQEIIRLFDIESKIIPRKKYYVVYLKEGAQIVDLLNICGAPVSLMELENMRILKEMRNTVNRRAVPVCMAAERKMQAAFRKVRNKRRKH